MTNMKFKTAIREFYVWRVELWWIFLSNPQYYPKGRKHLFGGLFWRKDKNGKDNEK